MSGCLPVIITVDRIAENAARLGIHHNLANIGFPLSDLHIIGGLPGKKVELVFDDCAGRRSLGDGSGVSQINPRASSGWSELTGQKRLTGQNHQPGGEYELYFHRHSLSRKLASVARQGARIIQLSYFALNVCAMLALRTLPGVIAENCGEGFLRPLHSEPQSGIFGPHRRSGAEPACRMNAM